MHSMHQLYYLDSKIIVFFFFFIYFYIKNRLILYSWFVLEIKEMDISRGLKILVFICILVSYYVYCTCFVPCLVLKVD